MENATKALLIAASILIAIVLIAVGIKVLSATSGVTDSVDQVSTAMGASVFNSQFEAFEGRQTAAEVKALISKVLVTYRDGGEHKILVYTESDANNKNGFNAGRNLWNDSTDIPGIVKKLQTSYTYTVSIKYAPTGYVDEITIK